MKEKAKIQKLKELEKEERKNRKQNHKALAVIQDKIAKEKLLSEFDRFDEDFVKAYMEDRRLKRIPERNSKAQQEAPLS